MFSSSHARSNNNSELKKFTSASVPRQKGNHLPFLKLVRRNRTNTNTRRGKKTEQKIERKQSFFVNCNIQYPRPRKEKDVGKKQEESGGKEEEKAVPCGHCERMFSLIVAIVVSVAYFLGPKSVPSNNLNLSSTSCSPSFSSSSPAIVSSSSSGSFFLPPPHLAKKFS
jgi:hypothetical protein